MWILGMVSTGVHFLCWIHEIEADLAVSKDDVMQKLEPPFEGLKCSFVGFDPSFQDLLRCCQIPAFDFLRWFFHNALTYLHRMQEMPTSLVAAGKLMTWVCVNFHEFFVFVFPIKTAVLWYTVYPILRHTQIQYCCLYIPLHPQYIPMIPVSSLIISPSNDEFYIPILVLQIYHPQSNQILVIIGSIFPLMWWTQCLKPSAREVYGIGYIHLCLAYKLTQSWLVTWWLIEISAK